jgi:hypothetical protein
LGSPLGPRALRAIDRQQCDGLAIRLQPPSFAGGAVRNPPMVGSAITVAGRQVSPDRTARSKGCLRIRRARLLPPNG